MEPDLYKEYPLYHLGKPIIRGGRHIDEHRFHNIVNFNYPFITVDNIGNLIDQEDGSSIHNEELCYINHYMTKSLEEFINKKYNKEDGSHSYKYDFEKGYFSINKHTLEKDNYINDYIKNISNKIGIFYIATGIYKKYFNDFYNTIDYVFPNKQKTLIIISDGLKEYHNNHKHLLNIYVEDFIDYPYPFININKFQIINHYAEKYNIDIIAYFDSDTYFIEKNENFFNNLIDISNKKFISLIAPYFLKFDFRGFIYGMNTFTLWNEYHGFNDFNFFYKDNYDDIDLSYKWIQTSFFMCSKQILNDIDIISRDLISYNMRVMGCKLNYSDEFYINYLNLYYPEKFYIDFFSEDSLENNNTYDTLFMYQKLKNVKGKLRKKFGNINYNFRMHIFNGSSDKEYEIKLNKFFIKHRNNFLLLSYGYNIYQSKIFFDYIGLNNEWFDNTNNIILEKTFYTENFIELWDRENIYVGFLNKINEYSNNFDYNKFYEEEYDYIEGYSFDDIKNMKFNDIDMCCFSKKYIEAYFNNDTEFIPKIYNININK